MKVSNVEKFNQLLSFTYSESVFKGKTSSAEKTVIIFIATVKRVLNYLPTCGGVEMELYRALNIMQ